MKKNSIKRNFIWNMIGTTFNSFNSLFFMIIVTRMNGLDMAGIFTFAFSTACLFYVVGVYSGRVYQVTENEDYSDSDYFYMKLITCFMMIISLLVFCFMRNYSYNKIMIISLLGIYKLLEAFSETFYAIIQKKDKLYIVGKSMFIKAILGLLLFIIIDYITKNMKLSITFIILVNLFVILFYDLREVKKLGFKLKKINKKHVIDLLRKGFYTFGFTFLTLYVINAPKYSVDSLMTNEDQTILGIIIMPATIIILFCQFIIQPFITKMKESLEVSLYKFVNYLHRIILMVIGIGILSTICAYFVGIPILQLMYNVELSRYLFPLVIIIIGATIYGISVVYSTALTTMRKTFCQLIIFLLTSIFSMIVSNIFTELKGIGGACFSYLLSMLFLLLLYVIVFYYQIKRKCKNEKEKK